MPEDILNPKALEQLPPGPPVTTISDALGLLLVPGSPTNLNDWPPLGETNPSAPGAPITLTSVTTAKVGG